MRNTIAQTLNRISPTTTPINYILITKNFHNKHFTLNKYESETHYYVGNGDGKLQSFCISTGMINKTVQPENQRSLYVSNSNFLEETLYTT